MIGHPRIAIDPQVLTGKPVVAGTRLAVDFIIGLLAEGWRREDIARQYAISEDDVAACLAYARDVLQGERVYATAE